MLRVVDSHWGQPPSECIYCYHCQVFWMSVPTTRARQSLGSWGQTFTFLTAVNELCRALIVAVIVNVNFCHVNCICFSCSGLSGLYQKKGKKKYLPEQLKAGQQQRARGPKADNVSPLVVDSRGTRTRR